ncbi:MAG: hypothetical protein WC464_02245 [Bdellovibrionales bacterium]
MVETVSKLWEEFEGLGEKEVRQRLAASIYGEPKTKAAHEWLTEKERQHHERVNAAQVATMRSQRNATQVAAGAAVAAAIFAALTYFSR